MIYDHGRYEWVNVFFLVVPDKIQRVVKWLCVCIKKYTTQVNKKCITFFSDQGTKTDNGCQLFFFQSWRQTKVFTFLEIGMIVFADNVSS